MPNWCNTNIKISGRDADKFERFVQEAAANASVKTDFGNEWLGYLLIHAGLKEDEVTTSREYGNCRGSVFPVGGNGSDGYVYDCDSAWSPCVDVFDTVCLLKGFDVDIDYLAVEPGCGIYYASSYEYAGGEYILDGYAAKGSGLEDILPDEGMVTVTKEELERRLRKHFNDNISSFKSLLDKVYDLETDGDSYLSINGIEVHGREEFRCIDGSELIWEKEGEKLSVLLVEPKQYPRQTELGTNLEDLQRAVGGYIQVVYPFDDPVGLLMNEEGKLNGLPLNRALRDDGGSVYDIIAGPFYVIGLSDGDFCSLTNEQIEKYERLFRRPEKFVKLGKNIAVFPMQDEEMNKETRKTNSKGR